ncbi:hypothetical protein PVK06_044585 [Gossypium arboreum]|uniref:Myb/SANT-like domain-containing protein n=1 Tax=Gossypium arboreum TaxID=29729 RepID=A0ABR0MS19_GOSAR|nr:hypothetical protein PVK06_044585 [Gossypium arboreum]
MARLPLIVQSERRKRIGLAITMWLQMCTVASWFLVALGAIHSLHTYRPRVRSYILDFYAKRDYIKGLVYASDETCIEQVRMNRTTFFKLCEMLQTLGELKSSRNMLVDEQVAMFLHIISHHLKNRVIKHHFNRSGETVSRSFHNVLNAVILLQDVLFKKAEPITANSTDPRWKWFKNCLGALDGTHIKIRVPTVDKPRYRTRKGDIVTNMLGVCTPDMQFVYVLPGWEGSVADGRVLRDAISRRHGLKVPHGFSQSSVSSQSSRGTKRKWVPEEDAALVACMVDLHNAGTFNADMGFKAGYLNELEKMIEKVLPNAMLKAKPNLESRIRTLKRDWSIVYDMLSGKNNSGFGWDEHRQLVVAEDAVWNSYISSHKEAAQFRHRSFPYYDQLTAIYAKDRATGKDAQTAADIIEEINVEDVAATNSHEERNDFHGSEADVSLDDMDLSATQPQPEPQLARNQGDSAFSKKKKKISDASDFSTSFNDTAALLAENIRAVGLEISKSIASEVVIQQKSEITIQESALKLYPTLCEVEGLTEDERYQALSKIPDHPTQMLIFFSLPSAVRLEWVRRFLADH